MKLIYGDTREYWESFRRASRRESAMDDLFQAVNFVVTLNDFVFGFQSVSGISVNKKVDYIEEGGVNDHRLMVACPNDENPTLTFKRGYIMRRNVLFDSTLRVTAAAIPIGLLRKAALIGVSSLDAQTALEDGPALGMIYVFNREKDLKAMYSFLSLGMVSWRLDDLDASGGSILCEEFTVAHQGLTRLSIGASIFGKDYGNVLTSNYTSEFEDDKYRAQEVAARERLKKKAEEERAALKTFDELMAEKAKLEEARETKAKEQADKLATRKAKIATENEEANNKHKQILDEAKKQADKLATRKAEIAKENEEANNKREQIVDEIKKQANMTEEEKAAAKEQREAATKQAIADEQAKRDANKVKEQANDKAARDKIEEKEQAEDKARDDKQAQEKKDREAATKQAIADEQAKRDANKAKEQAEDKAARDEIKAKEEAARGKQT